MSEVFTYCPRCGAPLAEGFAFGQARRLCRYCGFILFQDPKVACRRPCHRRCARIVGASGFVAGARTVGSAGRLYGP